MANVLASNTLTVLPLLSGAVEEGLLRWLRAAELTCDRAALLVAQDHRVVISALMKLAGGSPKLNAELNVEAFLRQVSYAVTCYAVLCYSVPYCVVCDATAKFLVEDSILSAEGVFEGHFACLLCLAVLYLLLQNFCLFCEDYLSKAGLFECHACHAMLCCALICCAARWSQRNLLYISDRGCNHPDKWRLWQWCCRRDLTMKLVQRPLAGISKTHKPERSLIHFLSCVLGKLTTGLQAVSIVLC